MTILLAILGVSLLVILHEAGHAITARAAGLNVSRFSLGFGPILCSRAIGATTYQLSLIPLGGYVLIDGMGDDDPEPSPSDSSVPAGAVVIRARKPAWQRALVIFAGPLSNFIVAGCLLTGLTASVGMSRMPSEGAAAIIGEVYEGGAAQAAGLRPGDRVLTVGGEPMATWTQFVDTIRTRANQPLRLVIDRQGQQTDLTVTPKETGGRGVIAAMPWRERIKKPFPFAIVSGFVGAYELFTQQASMLKGVFKPRGTGQLAGLPGIVKGIAQQAQSGMASLCEGLAWLSIGLCLLNLLPVPALDGSRLLFILIEAVSRRPVNARLEGMVHSIGFVVLMGIMLMTSVRDLL